jgi:hypothetical protein
MCHQFDLTLKPFQLLLQSNSVIHFGPAFPLEAGRMPTPPIYEKFKIAI